MAAGFHTVAVIREHQLVHSIFQHCIGSGVSALHFVEYNALVNRLLAVTQLIAPAFLAEDLRLVVDCGVQHRVHVHIQQVQKILVVAAADRIHGLIGIGHGIEEGIDRGLQQLHEGFLDRVLI